jgi:predicted nucleic acid-binding Zn ribbon protein
MVEDHKHCVVCGKAVSPDKLFCSQECEERLKQQQKRMARMRLYMILMMTALFLLIIVTSLMRSQ